MSPEEPVCQLIDTDTGPRRRYEPVPIWSLGELERLLRGYVTRHPRILEVHLPDQLILWVGIGGDLAAVAAYPIPNLPPGVWPCWKAQARRPYATEPREFANQGIPYEFEAASLMPPEEVIGIILYFVQFRDLPDSHAWGPPGPDQYGWGEGGTRDQWEVWRRGRYEAQDGLPF